MIKEFFIILFGAAIVNNVVLTRFLGICPFLGISKRTYSAVGMGIAVSFVMVLASSATWVIEEFLLTPLELPFLRYPAFILVIASLVQFVEIFLRKKMPKLFKAFGIYLPLITTNCAILGVALLNSINRYSFAKSVVFAFGSGVGFLLALVIMSGIRERLEDAEIPKALDGIPIALIVAGLLALAFSGFAGVIQ